MVNLYNIISENLDGYLINVVKYEKVVFHSRKSLIKVFEVKPI